MSHGFGSIHPLGFYLESSLSKGPLQKKSIDFGIIDDQYTQKFNHCPFPFSLGGGSLVISQ